MSVKPNPTPEQQRVIDMTDRTVLLSAAAGSGKTATLTERLIRMITRKEDPLDVTRMLVVTFTRAAAEELRVRISEALAAAKEEDPDNAYLSRQLLLLPTARIRTIDAFCNDLVKGHTDALGISPLYRIADEGECDLLGITVLDEVIEDAYSGVYAPEGLDIATIVEIAESVKGSGTLSAKLYDLYKSRLHGIRNGVALLAENAEVLKREATLPFFQTRAGKVLAAHITDRATHAHDLLFAAGERLLSALGNQDPIFLTLSERYFYLLSFADRIKAACADGLDALCALSTEYALPKAKSCPRGHIYTPEESLFKQLIGDTDDLLCELFSLSAYTDEDLTFTFLRTAEVSQSLFLLLSEFEDRFLTEKRRRAICDYDDITKGAYTLLLDEDGNPTSLARELQGSFDAVCIDEYQDVNEIQHRIFEAISTKRNRFMVGDIKQSIYAFRGALPDIFGSLRATFPSPEAESDRAVLYLTRNFRSEASVISYANSVFDFLFPLIGSSIGYVTKDRLVTEKDGVGDLLPTLYLMVRESKKKSAEEEATDAVRLKTEDELIAEKVSDLLANGKKKDGTRIRPSDIAILSREYPYDLVKTLGEHGIPLKTKDKTDFFSRKEILLALSLCRAVNNPHNDIPLAGLLRSPLYGFSMDLLIAIREETREGTLFDAITAYGETHPEDARIHRLLSDLARFRAMAENQPSYRLIRTMFSETGIYAATDESGRANLRTFYELARTYEATSFRGLYRFLQHTEDMIANGKGLPAHDTGDEEAVTVSTIHASKGLEYPVCFLVHTGKELKRADTAPFLFTKELGVLSCIPTHNGNALLSTPLVTAHTVLKQKRELEEAVRVLYVALTRPRERLYLFASNARKLTERLLSEVACLRLAPSVTALYTYSSYVVWMLAALTDEGKTADVRLLPPPYLLTDKEAPYAEEGEADKDRQLPARDQDAFEKHLALYRERFSYVYPQRAETLLPAKLSVSSLFPGVLDELSARSPMDAPKSPPAALACDDPSIDDFVPLTATGEDKDPSDDFTPTVPAFLSGVTENEAAKAGTATHLFLQFCDFDRILTTDGCHVDVIRAELARLCDRGFLTEADARRVRVNELAAFLASDLCNALREAREVRREFRFHTHLPASLFSEDESGLFDGHTVFVQGVVDLLFRRADGSLLLVDYKTDRLPRGTSDDEAAKLLFTRHGTQLAIYAHALSLIFGETPEVAIYSLPKGKLLFTPK